MTFKHIFLECRNLFHQETIPLMKYFYYPVSLWLVRDKRESTVRKTDRPARFQPTCTNWAAIDMTRKDKTNLCLFVSPLELSLVLREEKSSFICLKNPKESQQLLVPSPFLLMRHFVCFGFGHVPSGNLQYIPGGEGGGAWVHLG